MAQQTPEGESRHPVHGAIGGAAAGHDPTTVVLTGTAPSGRWLSRALLVLIFFALAVRVLLLVNAPLGGDEVEHLHAAWAVAHGQVPYRDFYQNHSPLLYYLMAPVFTIMGEDLRIIYVARGFMLLCILLILFWLYRIARACYDALTGLLAVLLLSYLLLFFAGGVTFGPDTLETLVVLVSLWWFMRAWERCSRVKWLVSGALLGIGFWVLTKTLFPLVGFTLVFVLSSVLRRSPAALRYNLTGLRLFLGAFAVLVVLGGFSVWMTGGLSNFLRWGVTKTFSYPVRFSALRRLHPHVHFVFLGLALIGILRAVTRMIQARVVNEFQLSPLLAGSVTATVFLFVMPAPNAHSALPFLPLAAMYGAEVLRSVMARALPGGIESAARGDQAVSFTWSPARLAWAALTVLLLCGVCVPPLRAMGSLPLQDQAADQLRRIRYVLALTSPGDSVFDSYGQYIFRPHATYFYRLGEGVLRWLHSGFIPDIQITNDLRKSHCKVIIVDRRLKRLPPSLLEFIAVHYVHTGFEEIAVAGRLLHPTDLTANRATVSLIASTEYAVQAKGGTPRVTIDGQVYRAPLLLAQGDHQVIVEGEFQALVIFWSRVLTVPFPRPAALPTGRPDRALPLPSQDHDQ